MAKCEECYHMSQGSTHDIQLTNGAAWWLFNLLNAPGIFTTTNDIFHVGTVMQEHLQPMEALKEDAWEDKEAGRLNVTWMAEPFSSFSITEGQREAIKRGLQALAAKGALAPHKYIISLLQTFGLKPE